MAIWFSRHPVIGYFLLVYGISWGGILILLVATGFNLGVLPPLETGLMFVIMLLGPSTSGLILTAALDGRDGLRRLWGNLTDWRVDLRWYAIALLTTPLLLIAILWPLSCFVDPAFAPRFQWPLFAIGLIAGCFEEIGWTGFATRRLLSRESLLRVGLGLGVIWALWHLLVDFRYNDQPMGGAWLLQFAVFCGATLTGYRLLMTWVYANTKSLLLAVLMHAAYTGWLLVLLPATSLQQSLLWQSAFAAGVWVAVALAIRIRHTAPRRGDDNPM
jgi:uncharacterized protein